MNTSKRAEIIAKVKKLLAMANDGRGNIQEAETAMRQAEALMRKHNIDMAETQFADLSNDPHACLDRGFYDQKYDPCARPRKSVEPWVGIIGMGVARLTETHVAATRKDGVTGLAFGGYDTDVVFALWLVDVLVKAVYYEARNKFRDGTLKERTDFRHYAACALQRRMFEIAEARKKDLQAEHTQSAGTALLVIDKKLTVIQEAFGEQSAKKANRQVTSAKAAVAGTVFGSNIHIPQNRPIGQSTQERSCISSK